MSITLAIRRIQRKIKAWFFIRGLGKVSQQYQSLTEETERAALLMEHFGKVAMTVWDDRFNRTTEGLNKWQVAKGKEE